MAKCMDIQHAPELIKDGMTIMVGGFMGCGSPQRLLDAISRSDVKDLTLSCNDGAQANGPDGSEYYGVAKLIHNHQVKKLIATHVGLNPEVAEQMNANEMEVVLVPQGSMAEMIRAGGAGLGGVLTPTGVGTIVEESELTHSRVTVNGKNYLLMLPLRADVALLSGYNVDRAGNIWYKGTTRNFNQVMATAADCVIVEAEHLTETGGILPENVMTPGILVDYIVEGGRADGTVND